MKSLKNQYGLNSIFTKRLDYGVGWEDITDEVMKDFERVMNQVEQSTIERCLKVLPNENFCREDNHLDEAINIGFRTCYKQSLSAIKKEFKRE